MLKSQPSQDKAYVSFNNKTKRKSVVVWCNYVGQPIVYSLLKKGQSFDVNTYKNHPWISYDDLTGRRLLLNGKLVFHPVSVREIHERLQLVRVPLRSIHYRRSVVNITLPLLTLSELCQYTVLQCLASDKDISYLDIPEILKDHLRKVQATRQSLRDAVSIKE